MNVMDLFSGVGGFSAGFKKAGFNIVVANEIDANIAISYQKNHVGTTMINEDINTIIDKIEEYKESIDVIIGGPPCQGFSMSGTRNRGKNAFLDDERNYLFRSYFSIVQKIEPTFFVIENVVGITSMHNGAIIKEIIHLFSNVENFKKGAYKIHIKLLKASDFGIPQDRSRIIIFGTKLDIDIESYFDKVKSQMKSVGLFESVSIQDAISDLNWLESGEGSFEQEYAIPPMSEYQKLRRKNSKYVYNHAATRHNKVAVDRIKELKPGEKRVNLTDGDSIKSVHSGAYGRMRWTDLAKTIITRFDTPSSGVYIHPERDRTITPREAARLQSFDDNFVFYGTKSSVIKQIGNAVPPLLAYYIANVIIKIKEDQNIGTVIVDSL